MKLLAIETSCDETSIAALEDTSIVAQFTASQIKTHRQYGGVVPEIASRQHAETINTLLKRTLDEATWSYADIDSVAATVGPGLEGALLVGVSVAKTLSSLLNVNFIGVNHLHGHIYSSLIEQSTISFPFICLLVSGGHTILVLVNNHFDFTILGSTRDDAVGEAFDKVGRRLGLPYPGGPEIDKHATNGDSHAFTFPKALYKTGFDFSFSGLKSAVSRQIQEIESQGIELPISDISASFQKAACDSLLEKTKRACQEHSISRVIVCGGVSANSYLRGQLAQLNHLDIICTPLRYCTDNAAMIGIAAYYMLQTKKEAINRPHVQPNLSL